MTTEEFYRLSLPQFHALCKRRFEEHRRSCYYSGIIAAMLIAVNTGKYVSPMQFVPSVVDRDKQRREHVKQNIRSLFQMRHPRNSEEALEMKEQMIKRLKTVGHADAEVLFDSVFPNLSRGNK